MHKPRTSQKKGKTNTSISPARIAALKVLDDTITRKRPLLENLPIIHSSCHNQKDVALAREIVSGTCRWLGRLRFYLKTVSRNLDNLPDLIQRILELSAYQLLYLERVPVYAVVSDAVELAKQNRFRGLASAVNGILRNLHRSQENLELPLKDEDFSEYLSVFYSHPSWLIKQWITLWGDGTTEAFCQHNNTIAPISLRLRGDHQKALEILREINVQFTLDERIPGRVIIDDTASFSEDCMQNPHWAIQDGAAMLVPLVLSPQPGWKVWDVCAAPGGKAFYLADLADDQGLIYATDRSKLRLDKLVQQNQIYNLSSIKTGVLDALNDPLPSQYSELDAILLDVPCTGWGTFRRHPDLRWRLRPDDQARLGKMALNMLEKVYKRLKSGGILIYSTCTLSKDENENVISRFVENHPEFSIESPSKYIPPAFQSAITQDGFLKINPYDWDLDGTFAARLKKM